MSGSPTMVEVILSTVSNLDARKVYGAFGSLWGTSEIQEGFGRFLSEIYSGGDVRSRASISRKYSMFEIGCEW